MGRMFNMKVLAAKEREYQSPPISYLAAIEGVDEVNLKDTIFKDTQVPKNAVAEYRVQYHLTFWNGQPENGYFGRTWISQELKLD